MSDQEFDSSKTMSEEEYLNMVFSHVEEALQYHGAIHALRFRIVRGPAPAGMAETAVTQRRTIAELAARLIENERDECLALAFKQYDTYLKTKGGT